MGDANKPHDIFLTQSSNGVSWGVCMPEIWQGRHRDMLAWKMGSHFSQDPSSCLLHSPCVGPVFQTRTLTRMVKHLCRQGVGIVVLQAYARGKENQRAVFERESWVCQDCADVAWLPARGSPLATCVWKPLLAKSHRGKGQGVTSYVSGMTFNPISISGLLPPLFSNRLNKPLKTWVLEGSEFRSRFCHPFSHFINKME